ncbi:COMM domain-containing protein 8 [Lucilia cuprina]|uniref:COMM domain-containing protein 8 n=1 Tax=Lucilia cuprina TaxID=7375 RepID=UPI001F0646AC|nr:COMM domain-containing protein 8 [Lucilia cuprina]
MKEHELLLNIDNKEILIEILNHSIDFLIGNQDEQQTMRMSHKYGFHNPDDFLLTTKSIAKFYRSICTSDVNSGQQSDFVRSELSNLTPEFQKIITSALQSRRNEVLCYLIREQNANEYPLIESFDWDTRLILGDSSFAQNNKILTTLSLNLRQNHRRNDQMQQLHIQMDYNKLNEFIKTIEDAIVDCK